MNSFRRAYLASLSVIGIFAFAAISELLSNVANSINTSILSVFGIALIPILAGGVVRRPRLALGIALSLTTAFGLLSLYYISHPTREEHPMDAVAGIVGLAIIGLLFFCPWLLTSIRGALAIRKIQEAEQAAP
jgi:hypothetical protein